jgi:conjugation system TraG family ATPase
MYAPLNECLPILEVAADTIVSKMGDITAALEVEKPEIFTLGPADFDTLHQAFIKALKVLPDGTVFHMQDEYRRDQYRAVDLPPAASMLQRASEKFFDGRPCMRHRCRIFLTRRPSGRRAVTSASSGLLRRVLVPADTLSPLAQQEFEDCIGQFIRILADCGLLKIRRIPTEELASSAKEAGLIEQYCYLLDGPDQPVIRDIDFGHQLRVGDQECLFFTLADPEHLPGQCAPRVAYERYSTEKSRLPVGFTAGLGILLPVNHIFNQYIIVADQATTLKKLEAKRRRLQSLANYSRENAISRDATNAFLNEAIGQQRQAVRAHFNLLCWTDSPAELKDIRNRVASAMAAIDAVAHQETIGAPQLWWAGIPGNGGDIPENECFSTFLDQACCFLNLESNYRSSESSFGLRFGDRLTGYPVHVDLDIEPKKKNWISNGNCFCLSGSGGGKSYLVNHMCRSYWDQGMHLVVVDVGHSYQVLCQLLGGYYFTYEENNPLKFNPFFIERGEVFDTEKKESLKSLLLALWKKSDETFFRSEYVAISNALTAYYLMLEEKRDVFPCFDSFYEFMEGDYAAVLGLEGVKPKDFDLDNFLYVTRPYRKGGEYDFLLNAKENLSLLDQRFIVFELDSIKDNPILFSVCTLVIVDVFMSKMRKLRGVRKMIVIEEAWKAIANAGMAQNILYWVKTVRKFMGKLMMVSQEIDDIVDSPVVKQAIINNSDCKILLDQSKFQNRFDAIQQLLGITEKQKAEILSINKAHDPGRVYKDCWIALGPQHSKVYRIETSIEEYLAYTSDQGEKVQIEAYAAKYGGMESGIQVLAEEMRKGKTLS